jgi:FtsH-binding integral membrane protein
VGSGVSALIVFAGTIVGVIGVTRARNRMDRSLATRRAGGLGLLALGTATLSASGTLNARFGEMRAFSITLAVGVVLLFVGFLLTGTRVRATMPDMTRDDVGTAVRTALVTSP